MLPRLLITFLCAAAIGSVSDAFLTFEPDQPFFESVEASIDFLVKLNNKPTEDVTVYFEHPFMSMSACVVVFRPDDWDVPQQIIATPAPLFLGFSDPPGPIVNSLDIIAKAVTAGPLPEELSFIDALTIIQTNTPPHTCSAGEDAVNTLDGLTFLFNKPGWYQMLSTRDIEVQVFVGECPVGVPCLTKVLLRYGSTIMSMDVSGPAKNIHEYSVRYDTLNVNGVRYTPGSNVGDHTITLPYGSALEIKAVNNDGGVSLHVDLILGAGYPSPRGLCNIPRADSPDNMLIGSDGRLYNSGNSDEVFDFTNSWNVKDEDVLTNPGARTLNLPLQQPGTVCTIPENPQPNPGDPASTILVAPTFTGATAFSSTVDFSTSTIFPPPSAPDGYVAPNPDGYVAPTPDGYVAPNPDGYVAPTPDGYVAPTPDGYVAPTPDGYVAPTPDGYVAPTPDGYVAPTPDGYVAPTPDGYVAPTPDGYVAPTPDGYVAPTPDGYVAPTPDGYVAPTPDGYVAPTPDGYVAPTPDGYVAPTPDGYVPPPPPPPPPDVVVEIKKCCQSIFNIPSCNAIVPTEPYIQSCILDAQATGSYVFSDKVKQAYLAKCRTLTDDMIRDLTKEVIDQGTKIRKEYGFGDGTCTNSCSGKGTCTDFGCACSPGFSGMDCSMDLTKATQYDPTVNEYRINVNITIVQQQMRPSYKLPVSVPYATPATPATSAPSVPSVLPTSSVDQSLVSFVGYMSKPSTVSPHIAEESQPAYPDSYDYLQEPIFSSSISLGSLHMVSVATAVIIPYILLL
ncbi:hypothetical protein BASA50_007720 [Batrachochytrium salamandrivorans]|uniref:EGF-like domain-containing protein n=1 Tax=Batrachochytrium salamandrivorans TaxID=1357716 RepID=A0ABQ8F6D5_9FUNG|nr:hypothetical protein BASA50_007720 [Batrachochytrium salamandrivorans]KAH9271915.1 hypothetical protein BASA83_005753 [Batrachochytrium salamandrivorans]